ncbi:MAG: tetratricopeptide repeat protein [Pseudomonadota bacterium]
MMLGSVGVGSAILLATVLNGLGMRVAALELLGKSVSVFPNQKREILVYAALVAEQRNDFENALNMLHAAGPPEDDSGFYFVELGNLHDQLGHYSEAVRCYNIALATRAEFGDEFRQWLADRLEIAGQNIN